VSNSKKGIPVLSEIEAGESNQPQQSPDLKGEGGGLHKGRAAYWCLSKKSAASKLLKAKWRTPWFSFRSVKSLRS